MGGLFSKSKKNASRVTEQDKAILQLKQQRDKVKQYQKRIEKSLDSDKILAKKLLSEGKRERAKLLLKKKRYQEQLLSTTDGQLQNLEKLTHDLEFAQVENQVLDGLKVGNSALKKVHEILSIDEIERIMEETQEGIEKQQEIDAILSGALSTEDEEAVDAEYDALVADLLPSVPVETTEPLNLPEVPSEEIEAINERAKKEKVKTKVALEA